MPRPSPSGRDGRPAELLQPLSTAEAIFSGVFGGRTSMRKVTCPGASFFTNRGAPCQC